MTKKLLLLFLDCVLIVLAVLSGLLCLHSTFTDIKIPWTLVMCTTVCTVLFCALFRRKKGWIAALVVLGVAAFGILALFDALKNSFICLLRVLMQKFNVYDWLKSFDPQLAPGVTTTTDDALMFLALLQVYLLSLSLSRWKRLLPGALSLLLTVFLCFVLQDTPPDTTPLMLVTFAVLVMALTQGVRRRAEEEAPLAVGIAALGAGLLLALLLWLIPPDEYDFRDPPVRWETISERLERVNAKLNNSGDASIGQGGKIRSVSLKRLPTLSNRPLPTLQVQSSRTGLTYLRGAAYSDFDGDSWEANTTFRWSKERLFPTLGGPADTEYTIKTENWESLIYTPQLVTTLPAGAEVVSDAYVANTDKSIEYTLYAMENLPRDPDVSEEQRQYRAWIDQACLQIPEQTRAYLLEWWEEKGGYGMDCTAEEVAERLSHVAEYSRTAEICPTDRDFCDWFLNDAQKGYCVHYATCLTAMLRALGKPARYVSGYVVKTNAGEIAQVTLLNAHAWTEVYVDGSWHIVDATPRDATEFTGLVPSTQGTPIVTDDLTVPEADHRPQRPTLPQRPEATETTEPARETEPTSTQSPDTQSPAEAASTSWSMPAWLRVVLGAVLLFALLVARRHLKRRLRERRFSAAEPNQETLLRWKRYRKLCRCLRISPQAEWTALANKAAFSQHRITPEEIHALRQEINRQERILYWSGFAKRLYYCYIRAII